MANKKLDLDNLDFTDLGAPPKKEIPEEKESVEEEEVLAEGYWVGTKSLSDLTHEEMCLWVAGKLPATNPKSFSKTAFKTTQKRQQAVDKVITLYNACRFPTKEKQVSYLH